MKRAQVAHAVAEVVAVAGDATGGRFAFEDNHFDVRARRGQRRRSARRVRRR